MNIVRNFLACAAAGATGAGALLAIDRWSGDREVVEYIVTQDRGDGFTLAPFNNFRTPLEAWRDKIPGIHLVDWDGNNELNTDEVRDYVSSAIGDGELSLEQIEKIGRIARILSSYDEDTHSYVLGPSGVSPNIRNTAKAFNLVYREELRKHTEREEAEIKTRLEQQGKPVLERPNDLFEPENDFQRRLERELRKSLKEERII